MSSLSAVPLPLDITIELKKNVSCHGAEDGAVTFVITGLSAAVKYSYKLKDAEGNVLKEGSEGLLDDLINDLPNLNTGLTIRFEDLAAGTYTFEWTSRPLSVLPATTTTKEFTIEEPDKFEIVDLNIVDIDCINPTGSIEVITSGGIGNIDLGILNLGSINLGGNGNTIIDLTEGVYDIIATDENGCEANATAEVENLIELPEVDITGDLNLGCHDLLDLHVSASDGVTLTLDTPDGEIVGGLVGNTFKVSTPGIYIATALDPLTGCVSSDTVEVVADVEIPELDLGTDRVLGCLDKLKLEAVTNATSIIWQNLSGTVLGNGKILEISAPGVYVAVALNDLGCENRDTVTVTPGDESDNATIEFQAGAEVNLGCLEVLDLLVINNDGLSINWETIGGSILEEPVDNILRVTKPGIYIASAVDVVTGCLVSDTIKVIAEVEIGTVDIPQDTLTLNCDGVVLISADTSALGANIQLLWETIEGDVEIDAEGTSVEIEAPGVYALVATDLITMCSASDTVVVEGSAPLMLDAEVENVTCGEESNGTISLIIEGGMEPYSVLWSTGATTTSITGLTPGEYTVTVTDARGCEVSESWNVEKQESPKVSILLDAIGEYKVEATAQVSGGQAPYQYLWSTGESEVSIVLSPGQYGLIVKDAAGCVASETFTVTTSDTSTEPGDTATTCNLQMTLTVEPSTDGETWEVEINTEGGTEPYSYEWNTGDTGSNVSGLEPGKYTVKVRDAKSCAATFLFSISGGTDTGWTCPDDIVVDSCHTPVFFSSPVIQSDQSYTVIQTSGLCSGSVFPLGVTEVSFLIIFEDESRQFCSFNVMVNPEPPVVDISLPGCQGETNGTITLTAPYISGYYLFWKELDDQEGAEVSGLAAGTYHVRGGNKSGCVINEQIILEEPDSLHLVEAVVVGSGSEEKNGQIQISIQGGTYPYSYQWTGPGDFTSSQEDLYQVAPGEYKLTVVDANNCMLGELAFEVEEDVSTDGDQGLALSGLLRTMVYPNPSNGKLNLDVELSNNQDLQVTIIDQNGRTVANHEYDQIQDSIVHMDISDLVSGLYFVRLRTKDALLTRKIMVFK